MQFIKNLHIFGQQRSTLKNSLLFLVVPELQGESNWFIQSRTGIQELNVKESHKWNFWEVTFKKKTGKLYI